MKWYFALKLTFREAMDQGVVTDPPVLLHMNPKIDFTGTNYEHDLNEAMKNITEQIDNVEPNGSGCVVDNFQTLCKKIVTYAPRRVKMT